MNESDYTANVAVSTTITISMEVQAAKLDDNEPLADVLKTIRAELDQRLQALYNDRTIRLAVAPPRVTMRLEPRKGPQAPLEAVSSRSGPVLGGEAEDASETAPERLRSLREQLNPGCFELTERIYDYTGRVPEIRLVPDEDGYIETAEVIYWYRARGEWQIRKVEVSRGQRHERLLHALRDASRSALLDHTG